MKEVETEKQLRDEVLALKSQIQKLQEEKLASAAAAAALPVEQPDPTTKIVHFLNNPLQQVQSLFKYSAGNFCFNKCFLMI